MTGIQGIVLAGGKSSRFGSDKALACLDGKPLVEHAVGLIRSLGLKTCVITSTGRNYTFLNCPVYFDRDPFLGPLAGLGRAFELFSGQRLLVLTCDMPFLTTEVLMELLNADNMFQEAVLFKLSSDYFQPFPGIYASSLQSLIQCQDGQKASMQHFIKGIQKKFEIDAVKYRDLFININEPGLLSRK